MRPAAPSLQGRPCDLAHAAREHRGLAHLGRGQRGGAGDRVQDDALERALPDLAHEQLAQEVALGHVRALEEGAQRALLALGGARARVGRDRREDAIHVGESERLAPRLARRDRGLDRPPADPDAALGQRPREVERGQLGLPLARLPEEVGDERGLLRLPARAPDASHQVDESSQLHAPPSDRLLPSRACENALVSRPRHGRHVPRVRPPAHLPRRRGPADRPSLRPPRGRADLSRPRQPAGSAFLRSRCRRREGRGASGPGRSPPPARSRSRASPCCASRSATPADTPPFRQRLIRAGVPCYEADVRFAMRYLIDRRIRGSLAITGTPREAPGGGVVFDDPEVEPSDWVPRLRVLSFDIETDPRGRRLLSIGLHGAGASEVLLLTPPGWSAPPGCGALRHREGAPGRLRPARARAGSRRPHRLEHRGLRPARARPGGRPSPRAPPSRPRSRAGAAARGDGRPGPDPGARGPGRPLPRARGLHPSRRLHARRRRPRDPRGRQARRRAPTGPRRSCASSRRTGRTSWPTT